MPRILITDGEQRSALAAVRSLGKAGHDLHVASTRTKPLAGASRFTSSTVKLPDPASDPSGYRIQVADHLVSSQCDILLPMTDASATILLGLEQELEGLIVPFPSKDAYESISDKATLLQRAHALGVPTPRQVTVDDRPDDLARARAIIDEICSDGIGPPIVLKPARSAVSTSTGVVKGGVRIVATADGAARDLLAFRPEAFPILAQQRISGPGLGAFLLRWNGETLAAFAHRRIREHPPQGGVSVYRESVPVRADLMEHAERVLEAFDWQGVAMVEFKEDVKTGVPYLMEVNGRFWGSLQLALHAGVDFPALLVSAAVGHAQPPITDYRAGVRCRWLWGDVDHTIAVLRAKRRDRAAHPGYPGRLKTLSRFLLPWRPGDRTEVLSAHDPRPFLRESIQWFQDLGS